MEHVQRRYDFQTTQIKRQHDHATAAFAARQMRDQTIRIAYKAKHIDYDTYRAKMKESRREMFRQEKISCLNYKVAMMSFDVQMYTDQPETYIAPKE